MLTAKSYCMKKSVTRQDSVVQFFTFSSLLHVVMTNKDYQRGRPRARPACPRRSKLGGWSRRTWGRAARRRPAAVSWRPGWTVSAARRSACTWPGCPSSRGTLRRPSARRRACWSSHDRDHTAPAGRTQHVHHRHHAAYSRHGMQTYHHPQQPIFLRIQTWTRLPFLYLTINTWTVEIRSSCCWAQNLWLNMFWTSGSCFERGWGFHRWLFCFFFSRRYLKNRWSWDHRTGHTNVPWWVLETHLFWRQMSKSQSLCWSSDRKQ